MSHLSESQRLRAEQNRLKALQIRRQRMAALASAGSPQTSLGSSLTTSGVTQATPTAMQNNQGAPQSTAGPLSKSSPGSSSAGVGASAFYSPHNYSPSITSTSRVVKNTAETSQATTRAAAHDIGTMGPAPKHLRIGAENKSPSKGTCSLSPDVLRRIEENKRKAQEKQEALRRARGDPGHGISSVSAVPKTIPGNKEHSQSKTQSTASRPSKVVTVSFVLTSVTRFRASTSLYHSATVQVFKTVASRKYDCNAREWNFNISDHKKLLADLLPLQPEVEVQPLPQFVLMAVEAATKKVPAEYINLFGLDARLQDALMPFQVEGIKFGISLGGRVMLADDMGLGKTIQALGIACHYRPEWPLLVVTPSSMRYSWEQSILRWVSSLSGQDVVVMSSGGDHFQAAQVVVVSYDLLARNADNFLRHNFGVAIFDESHMIKSYKSARYKAASPIMKKLKRVILCSGTPALSRPLELYTQISGIDPSLFPRFQEYGIRYCQGRKDAWGWSFKGSSNTEELQIILQSCLWIRRLKSDVLSQLPPKQRMTVILDPNMIKNSKKKLEDMAKKLNLQSLAALQETAYIQYFTKTAEAKLSAVREYVKEVLETGKKFLVFAHHKVMLDTLCTLCLETKTRFMRIDGKTSPEERMANVSEFQNDEEMKVAVLSITAANTGITLTAAHLVVFAELYWNPGVLVQAEDRTHRIGQKDSVVVQYLVARNTADDHIWPLIQSKLEVLGKVGLSDDMLDTSSTSYQKPAADPDIRDYLHSENTSGRQQLTPSMPEATQDIRCFFQSQDQLQSPHENS